MADSPQSPIAPEQAAQLLDSSLVQDPAVKQQLGTLVAPAPLQNTVAEQPESMQSFTEQITEVPSQFDPAIQAEADAQVAPDPASMSKEQRAEYMQKMLDKRMVDSINSGDIDPGEAVKQMAASKQIKDTAAQQQEAASLEGRTSLVNEKWQQYIEAKNKVDQFNQLAAQFENVEPRPEPNMLEFLTESDISFAAESGMDIPPAAARRAEMELEQLDVAKQQAEADRAAREVASKQQAEQRVAVEEQEKQVKRQQIAQDEVAKEDKEAAAKFTSFTQLFKDGSTAQKFGAALAIMVGGLSQGLMGAKSNPVIDFLNKEFDRNDAKKQQALKLVKEQLAAKRNLLKDQKTQLEMQKLMGELDLQSRQLNAKRVFDKIVSQGGEVPESLLTTIGADKEARDRIVRGPDGKAYVADTKQAAVDLRKAKDEAEPAIQGIDELLELSRTSNRLNLRDRAKIYSRVRALVGKLRIPLTGPGVLTDTEYERLLQTLGDPNKIFAIKSIEDEKLRAVKDILQNDLKTRYRNAGVQLPMTKQEKILQQVMKNNPNASEANVIRVLRKKGLVD